MITPLVYIIETICELCEKRNEFYVQSGTKFDRKFSVVIYKVHTPINAHFIKSDKVLKFTLKITLNCSYIFYVLLTVRLSIFISVIKLLDAQNFCFTISLFHASTCFEHMCSSSGGQN